MTKYCHDDILDAALNYIKNNCTRMTACSQYPTTYLKAITASADMLADVTMSSSDFTVGLPVVSGRKVAVAAKADEPITSTGTATHVALVDVANTKLLYVTTCADLYLTGGQLMDFATWNIEIRAPS